MRDTCMHMRTRRRRTLTRFIALSGSEGEPARVVVSERIAETCRRLGCIEAPLTWMPPEDMALSEDNMVEAWLLAKRSAGMRGVHLILSC